MFNESIISLLVMILLEIAMSTFIFWNHHRLDIRVLPDAIWVVINHIGFISMGYGILGYLGPSFPERFSLLQLMFIASGIVLVCLLFGYWLDLLLSQSNWWGGNDGRSRKQRRMQRKP